MGTISAYGLNVQAMCGPDLEFLYVAVVAPGRTNDIRAYGWCENLHRWLESLPEQYFISADNAYPISRSFVRLDGSFFLPESMFVGPADTMMCSHVQ